MATSFSSKSKALGSARSISLPSRSHPTTAKTEEELNKLKSWETTSAESSDAEVICSGLQALSELQKCVDCLLNLPHTIQALSRQEDYQKWADELLENSVKILDICGTTREIVLQFKECVWDLQSCLRRRKGDHVCNKNKFNSFGKKMKQEARRLITSLKKMDQQIWSPVLLDVGHHVSAVIRALRESSSMANSVLQKVLLFLSMVVSNSKPSKWSLVSRLVLHKVAIASQEEEHYRTKKIDELERLGAQLEGIENGLENSFRALIRSRTSLLNVISCPLKFLSQNSS